MGKEIGEVRPNAGVGLGGHTLMQGWGWGSTPPCEGGTSQGKRRVRRSIDGTLQCGEYPPIPIEYVWFHS